MAALLPLVLTAVGCALCLPQIAHLLRSRTSAGVSLLAMVNGLFAYGFWTLWFVHEDDVGGVVATVAPMAVWALATYLSFVYAPVSTWWPQLGWKVVLFPLVGAAALTVSWQVLGMLLAVAVSATVLPAAWTAWTESDLSGLSAGTWLLYLVETLAWGGYGLHTASLTVVVYGVVGATGSSAVLLAHCRWRRRSLLALLPVQRSAPPALSPLDPLPLP